jgi:uncharacterized protein (DUF1800 family)
VSTDVDEREAIARLHRRAAFGLAPGELDELAELGVDAVVDRLVDPDAHGVPATTEDLWADLTFDFFQPSLGARDAVEAWLDHLLVTPRPFEDWMAWYWHGHLVTSVETVTHPPSVTDQISLFRRQGLGSFADLLRAITVDAAMLRYLDGGLSTGTSPNENYAREMLELFALGLGQFFEPDVVAGARALTGWRIHFSPVPGVERLRAEVQFVPEAHDDTPQRYLGRDGVHDVDTVVATIVSQPACADFVAGRFGRAVLGPDADEALLADLGRRFRASDLDLRVLARGVLEAVAEGRVAPLVLGPVPWLLAAQRATGASLPPDDRYDGLAAAGQLPLSPPNVGGWAGGTTWLAASTTAQRFNLAGALAAATAEDNPALRAATEGDLEALSDALGRPTGFSEPTAQALRDLAGDDGVGRLTVALASPDMVLA